MSTEDMEQLSINDEDKILDDYEDEYVKPKYSPKVVKYYRCCRCHHKMTEKPSENWECGYMDYETMIDCDSKEWTEVISTDLK
jgi:uncharacterized CHY-type Zn-finger protein